MPKPMHAVERSEEKKKRDGELELRLRFKQRLVGSPRTREKRRNVVNFASRSASKKKASSSRGRGRDSGGGGDGSIKKRRRRFRPGTVAMREILDIQSGKHSTTNLIRKLPMYNLIRETMQGIHDYRLTASAVAAIHMAAEDEMVKQFEVAQLQAIHAGRETIQPKDIIIGNQVRSIHPAKAHMPYDPTKIYTFRGDGPKKRSAKVGEKKKKLNIPLVKKSRRHTMKQRHQDKNVSQEDQTESLTHIPEEKDNENYQDEPHSSSSSSIIEDVVEENKNKSDTASNDEDNIKNDSNNRLNSDDLDISVSLSSLVDDDDDGENEEEEEDGEIEPVKNKTQIITSNTNDSEVASTGDNDAENSDEL